MEAQIKTGVKIKTGLWVREPERCGHRGSWLEKENRTLNSGRNLAVSGEKF